MSLAGSTALVVNGSRGVGKAIAEVLVAHGAHVGIAGKTTTHRHPLHGTIYSAVDEINERYGCKMTTPVYYDTGHIQTIKTAISTVVKEFGGLDILINTASCVAPTPLEAISAKTVNIINSVNIGGFINCIRESVKYISQSSRPHVLTICPPIDLDPRWFARHTVYSVSKYSMSMSVIGLAEEFRHKGIPFNGLWPKTALYTSSISESSDRIKRFCRRPEILGDAVLAILQQPPSFTGNLCVDEDVLFRLGGVTDFSKYAYIDQPDLLPNLFMTSPEECYPAHIGYQLSHDSIDSIFVRINSLIDRKIVMIDTSFTIVLDGVGPGWTVEAGMDKIGFERKDSPLNSTVLYTSSDRFIEILKGNIGSNLQFVGNDQTIRKVGDTLISISNALYNFSLY